MYNFVIKDDIPVGERTGNWNHEFYIFDDIARYLKTQFKDKESILRLLNREEQ